MPDYTYYLRVTTIAPTEAGFALAFEVHRFVPKEIRRLDGVVQPRWQPDGSFTAQMRPAEAPPGYPAPGLFFVGDIATNPDDPAMTTQIQIGWVSPLLRKAVIEVDRVPGAAVPESNGAGVTWQSTFRSFGWDMNLIVSDDDVTKPGGPVWNAFDAGAAMRKHRDSSDLDNEWRYHIMVAGQIAAPGDAFGHMYHPKREALYMTSQFVFPENEAKWGALRGKRFDTTVSFFRTAMHEMGHALGLPHNNSGSHFMRPTPDIADDAPAGTFPANIAWSFDPGDEHRLRHWPDIVVRPGGAPTGICGETPLPEARRA